MLVDFHSHTTLSDGTLSVEEMVGAAERRGYDAYAITDHVHGTGPTYQDQVRTLRDEINRLAAQTSMHLFTGVELTDIEPDEIPRAAEEVRRMGAQVVVVHGECVTMAVAPGTNAAAVRSPGVDILAHPGLVSPEDAATAARHGIYLELSARAGHAYANGHVYRAARRAGAQLIVDSDSHDEAGMLSAAKVSAIVRGAGASDAFLALVRDAMAASLLQKLLRRYARGEVLPGSHR